MKHTYLLLLALFAIQITHALIVDIPDANFKNALLNHTPIIDTDGDGEIQISEAEATNALNLIDKNISDLTGIEYFINLQNFYTTGNNINIVDLSNNTDLSEVNIQDNASAQLEVDLSNNSNLLVFAHGNSVTSSLELTLPSNNTIIEYLIINNTQISNLSINTNNTNIGFLQVHNNQLIDIDFGNYIGLNILQLDLSGSTIETVVFPDNSPNVNYTLNINNTSLTELDLSNISAHEIDLYNNPQLAYLNLKNGSINANGNGYGPYTLGFSNCPNLIYICADENEISNLPEPCCFEPTPSGVQDIVDALGYTNCVVNSYCSFEPGGDSYTIQGETKIDINSDGCGVIDNGSSNLRYNISNGSQTGAFTGNASGAYTFPVGSGTHTITPILENPIYYAITPTDYTVSFPSDTSPYTQDFCITPNGTYNDLEVTILPLEAARPGFDANYKITYKNKGTTTLSGTIDFMFQDDVIDLVSANPTADAQTVNNLSWNYSNLAPFESGEILLTMNLNAPTETPPINGDDVLVFTATANPTAGDETPEDNTFTLNQLVVNSFDPNDKTCLEGSTITPELIGEYVHYLIRFENTGTANAINVVVKDVINDTKFDVSSLFISDSSHELVTKITGSTVEFIFENINLPFDDVNNDGYIAFKIKTLPTLVTGDTFENDAEIYFDFNFPIDTNIAQTTVEQTLGINTLEALEVSVYPNPVQDVLNIRAKDAIETISVYDISGRLINQVALIGNPNEISIKTSDLAFGTYFVKVKTEVGEGVEKIIKE